MTNKEFSAEFDLCYNNINSGKAPEINEYEKSVLLTKAQEQIIKNYFNPFGNKYRQGHAESPKRTIDFSNIIKAASIQRVTPYYNATYRNTMAYKRPDDVFIPISFVLRGGWDDHVDGGAPRERELQVVPVTEAELTRLFSKPFKQPFKRQALKIDNSTNDKYYEFIVGNNNWVPAESGQQGLFYSLHMRYVKFPRPIILMDLDELELELGIEENFLSIRGQRAYSECELDPEIHDEILDRAVNLAKAYYEGSPETVIQYSSNNE